METKQERQLPEEQVKALEFLAETPKTPWKSKTIEHRKGIELGITDIKNLRELGLIEAEGTSAFNWKITKKGLERLEGG